MLVLNRYQRRLLSRLRMNYPARERVLLNRAIDSLAMAGLVEYEASDFRSTKKNVNQYVYVWLSPIPNRIHYSVCEMCTNRNEELLNTVDQLERELALLTESNVPKLSAWSTTCKYKLEHLVSKFRKLKMQHVGHLVLLSMIETRIKELKQENSVLQRKLEQHWIASRTHKPVKESNMAKLDITLDELTAGDMTARGVSIVIDGISAEDAARVSLRLLSAIDPMEADDFETPQHVCTCHVSDEDKRPPYVGKPGNAFAPMDVE